MASRDKNAATGESGDTDELPLSVRPNFAVSFSKQKMSTSAMLDNMTSRSIIIMVFISEAECGPKAVFIADELNCTDRHQVDPVT